MRAPSRSARATRSGLTSCACTSTPRPTSARVISSPCAPTPTTSADAGSGASRRRSAVRTTAVGSTHTRVSGAMPAIAHAKEDGTTSRSANAPWRLMPTDWRRTQAEVRPRPHCSHVKQATFGSTTTVSPTRPGGTRSPTASIVPNASWPMIQGDAGDAHVPLKTLRSEPHSPTPPTAIITSSGPSAGSGTSSITISPGRTSSAAFTIPHPGAGADCGRSSGRSPRS